MSNVGDLRGSAQWFVLVVETCLTRLRRALPRAAGGPMELHAPRLDH